MSIRTITEEQIRYVQTHRNCPPMTVKIHAVDKYQWGYLRIHLQWITNPFFHTSCSGASFDDVNHTRRARFFTVGWNAQ